MSADWLILQYIYCGLKYRNLIGLLNLNFKDKWQKFSLVFDAIKMNLKKKKVQYSHIWAHVIKNFTLQKGSKNIFLMAYSLILQHNYCKIKHAEYFLNMKFTVTYMNKMSFLFNFHTGLILLFVPQKQKYQ